MNRIKNFFAFTLLFSLSHGLQAKTADTTDQWHLSIAPYFWAASLSGNVTVRGFESDIFLPFYKVLDNFDGGGEVHLEGGYGPWTAMLDTTYIKLSSDFQRRRLKANISSSTLLIDTGVFYRVWETAFASAQSLSLEVLGGARYLALSDTLKLGFTRVNLTPGISVTKNFDVIAPIVGGRVNYHLNPKVQFWLRADVGGFGVDSVKNTWSTTLGGAYGLTSYLDLGLAYRVLQMDVRPSAQNAVNTTMYGFLLGLNLHF